MNSFGMHEIFAEIAYSFNFRFKKGNVMEITTLVEFFELVVYSFSLSEVRFNW